MDDTYKNDEAYNPNKTRKILIVFDDMIADMIINKKLNPIVTELFIQRKKNIYIFLDFITQSYFSVLKNVRLNSIDYFAVKIPNKRELQQITLNHSSDIDFQDFMNLYKKFTAKPKLVKERFDEIKELNDEINENDLTYYFKGNTARKRFDDFNNSIELFKKIKSGELKIEEAK